MLRLSISGKGRERHQSKISIQSVCAYFHEFVVQKQVEPLNVKVRIQRYIILYVIKIAVVQISSIK